MLMKSWALCVKSCQSIYECASSGEAEIELGSAIMVSQGIGLVMESLIEECEISAKFAQEVGPLGSALSSGSESLTRHRIKVLLYFPGFE